MPRKSLVDFIADDLLGRIIDGEFHVGGPLPSAAELEQSYEVARVTLREALRSLTAQGVVTVQSGKQTIVNPVTKWQPLDAQVRYYEARDESGEIAVQLIQVRQMFESAASALAAGKLSQQQIEALNSQVELMRLAYEKDELELFVRADLAFHDIILEGSGNVFLPLIFAPLREMFVEKRRETSRVREIREHAIEHHQAVLDALKTGSARSSRDAMEAHIEQTLEDLNNYILEN